MRHPILKTVCLCGAVVATALSCDDYDDLYPQKYEKILMLKDGGEHSLTLYTTETVDTFTISVMKTGSNTKLTAEATLRPMTADELADYSEIYGTTYYAAIPSDCYSFSGGADGVSLSYGSEETYKFLDVFLNPNKIREFQNTLSPDRQPVIPLILVSAADSVSSESNRIFICPEVIVPTIYFEVSGFNRYGLSSLNSDGDLEINIPVTMPIENRWNFDCHVEKDEKMLETYNSENQTEYELLPESMYTMQTTCRFNEGSNTTNIKVVVKKSDLNLNSEYVLPVRLVSSELEGVDIDAERGYCLAHISCKVALTVDMLSANSIAQDENGNPYDGVGLAGLIDGNGTTGAGLFHTGYGYYSDKVDATYGKYVDFHLPFSVTSFLFDFMSRNENANGVPQLVELYVSTDGSSWTKLADVKPAEELTGGGQWATFGPYTSGTEFSYIRFAGITGHGGGDLRTDVSESWNCQEFVLYAK